MRALRQLARDWPENGGFVFVSERGGPMGTEGVKEDDRQDGHRSGPLLPRPPASALTWLQIQARQRRTRDASVTDLLGPQEFPAHRAIHRAELYAIQGLLLRLADSRI